MQHAASRVLIACVLIAALRCPLLRSLLLTFTLQGCQALSDVGLSAIGQGISESTLEMLSLQGCVHLTDVGVAALARGLNSCALSSIDFSW